MTKDQVQVLGKNYLGTNKALLSRLRMICSRLSLLTDSHWSSMRAYWDQSGMGYGMDIRIQLLPTNEVPQESAKTGPGISDLCSRVCVGSSVLTLDSDREYFKHLSSTSYSPPHSDSHTPVSSCNHQSQLRRWKHGSDFICIGRYTLYTTCLPQSHAAQV